MTIYTQTTINGVTITDISQLDIDRNISDNNAVSAFRARLNNYAGYNANKFNVGDEIIVYADKIDPPTTKIFAGILEDIQFRGEGIREIMELSGKDYSVRLLDRTVEPETYASLTPGSITKDIINKYTENLTTTNVDIIGGSLAKISFNHTPVFDAVKQLAEFGGYSFYVDEDKDLHFELAGGSTSTFTFDNSNVLRADFKTQRDTLYNQIWVYGDRYLDAFKETLIAGSPLGGSIFTLLYKPSNTQVTVSGGLIQPGGIYQMIANAGSNVKYLVDYDNKQIIFTSGTEQGNNIPTSGNSVVIDYMRGLPIVKVGDDFPSQTQFGKRVKVIQDKNIKDPKTAVTMVNNELERLNQPATEGNLKIKGIANIIPGRTCMVNLPNHEISGLTYDIIEVNYNINSETRLNENILGVRVNQKLPDITDTIKDMMLQIKKLQAGDISDSDILTRLQSSTGSESLRTSGLFVYTRTLTTSGLRCFWTGGDIAFCGTLASGTLQKNLFGEGNGSPTTAFSISYSGGFF